MSVFSIQDARYAAVSGLRTVDYDEESVVFNDVTWETHVLNTAAVEVLALCTQAARSCDDIARALTEWLDADDAPDATGHAARIVEELHALGLIAPIADPASRAGRKHPA